MTFSLEFSIPMLPKSVNGMQSMHWAAKSKYVHEWHRMVAMVVGQRKPPKPLERAKLTLRRFSSVEPDFDNLVNSFKHVLDGLVECGVLADDKVSNVGQPEYRWEKCKPRNGCISVSVREVA